MANIFLTKGKLITLLDLEHIDILSFIIAGVCHDFGHDGYNNLFHINTVTDRAVRYNDVSVQESYHVAESFAILRREEANFLE
jgi:hypothetical protein